MGLNERDQSRKFLEAVLKNVDLDDPTADTLLYGIKRAEEAGLSYEEIVKLIISYLEHYANCTQDQ